MYCHDMEVMILNPGWVEHGVLGTSVLIILEPKIQSSLLSVKIRIFILAEQESSSVVSEVSFEYL